MAWYIYVRDSAPPGRVPQSWGPYRDRESAERELARVVNDKPARDRKRFARSLYLRED